MEADLQKYSLDVIGLQFLHFSRCMEDSEYNSFLDKYAIYHDIVLDVSAACNQFSEFKNRWNARLGTLQWQFDPTHSNSQILVAMFQELDHLFCDVLYQIIEILPFISSPHVVLAWSICDKLSRDDHLLRQLLYKSLDQILRNRWLEFKDALEMLRGMIVQGGSWGGRIHVQHQRSSFRFDQNQDGLRVGDFVTFYAIGSLAFNIQRCADERCKRKNECCKLLISDQMATQLIGHRGTTIKKLRRKSKCQIIVEPHPTAAGHHEMRIIGDSDGHHVVNAFMRRKCL